VTLGIPGMLAWSWALVAPLASATRRLQGASMSREGRVRRAAAVAGVASGLVGNLVGFDITATATTTWLLLALGIAPELARETRPPDETRPATLPAAARSVLVAALWVVVAAAIVQYNVRPVGADIWHRAAVRLHAAGEMTGALRAAERGAAWWPIEPAHHLLLGQVALSRAMHTIDPPAMALAEAALLRACELRPLDPRHWAALGDLYTSLGALGEPAAWEPAHAAYARALALAPNHARLHVAWGDAFLRQDRPEDALALLYRAYDLDATDGLALRLIGDVELALGRGEDGLAAYREAVRWAPEDALVHLGLARAHAALGEGDSAWAALGRAVELAPEHPAVRAVQEQWGQEP
jgi:tetratricopeptide (TPR) repeat protein